MRQKTSLMAVHDLSIGDRMLYTTGNILSRVLSLSDSYTDKFATHERENRWKVRAARVKR